MSPESTEDMVLVVRVGLRRGGAIEVRAPRLDARWIRALFTRNAKPFEALKAMGYEVDDGTARTQKP